MREVEISRADGPEVEPVLIRIGQTLPDIPGHGTERAEKAFAEFARQGAAIADAIYDSCPGGTVDALLSNLLARKASQFRVTFPKEPS